MGPQDGRLVVHKVAPGVRLSSTEPDFTEGKAKQRYREMIELARQGEYEFIGTRESESGVKTYLYKFSLSDCPSFIFGSDKPIEEWGFSADSAGKKS
jgi:hypothetical protein